MKSRWLIVVVLGVAGLGWTAPQVIGRAAAEEPQDPAALVVEPNDAVERSDEPAPPKEELAAVIDRKRLSRSGALRVLQALPGEEVRIPLMWTAPRPGRVTYRWVASGSADRRAQGAGWAVLGEAGEAEAPAEPGIYRLELRGAGQILLVDDFDLIVKVPFHAKKSGYLKGYLIGTYPAESRRRPPGDRYAPPEGFIEVTRENRGLRLSDHFVIGEFLTKNQANVWPKYVVVEPRLVDKLELVLQELNAMGVKAERMVVMSGYRTPQYNRQGLNRGRASLSRHQFGDAADVWVDNDGDWYMDDLNGDGRRDTRDARVMLEAVERVERKYPELVGGAGIYPDNGVHGPFIHIDVRGTRARW